MVRAAQLPLLSGIRLSATIDRAGLVPDGAFVNGQAIDATRAFLPFGDRPKIGDALYLGSRDAFGQPGAAITVGITLVNPVPARPPGSTLPPSADLQLKWEAWNGTTWTLLGTSTPNGAPAGSPLVDNSNAFTQSKPVTFTLPQSIAPTSVNGVLSNWIRVQIVAGNYGVDTAYVADTTQPSGFKLVLSTLAPPLVSTLTLSSHVTTAPSAPDAVIAFNNAQFEDIGPALSLGSAAPFTGLPTSGLYAAFTLPPGRKSFPNRTVSLYHGVRLPPYGEKVIPLSPELSVQPAAAGDSVIHHFALANVSDDSVHFDLATVGGAWVSSVAPPQVTLLPGLSTAIAVSVTVPAAAQLPAANVSDRGFLNVRLSSDAEVHSVAFETRVGNVSPPRRELRYEYWNGGAWARLVAADGTDRLTQPGVVEFLGPADIVPVSQFGVTGYWVRAVFEPGDDPLVQLRALSLNTTFASQTLTLAKEVIGSSDASANQQFSTAKSPVLAGPQLEVRESGDAWTPWIEVTDFFGSTSQDRHFIVDHITGEVRFGDGVQGRIPPRGAGNIRMARYQTGGGETGNRAAGTIVQMKTTVPYIDSVTNLEPAEDGVAAESTAALLTRAPRALRHGGRAVALEDYEDLARAASPEVARAKTVSLHNLLDDPLGSSPTAGTVSVVVVPLSADEKPVPSIGLLSLVDDYVRSFSTPTASLAVVGPLYVRVDVSVEIALVSLEGASAVENAVRDTLQAFLHPLTGGRDGTGWDFGRRPFLSDLYAVVSDVPGVDHIRQLSTAEVEEQPGALGTGRFLVHSGQHQITLTFVGAE